MNSSIDSLGTNDYKDLKPWNRKHRSAVYVEIFREADESSVSFFPFSVCKISRVIECGIHEKIFFNLESSSSHQEKTV